MRLASPGEPANLEYLEGFLNHSLQDKVYDLNGEGLVTRVHLEDLLAALQPSHPRPTYGCLLHTTAPVL